MCSLRLKGCSLSGSLRFRSLTRLLRGSLSRLHESSSSASMLGQRLQTTAHTSTLAKYKSLTASVASDVAGASGAEVAGGASDTAAASVGGA